ncbi:MAG: ribosomal-processing cysteine protease Prp [Bacilli bacterium]|nr:ribosomal-processing cysteine protease Prp [Bacilli bacterium]
MIKVNVNKKDNQIDSIVLSGHAMYDDYGKDIVCASVSSIVITTVNAIIRINNDAIEYRQDDDLVITIKLHDKVTDLLIENMLELLTELEKQYKKNIKINI